MLRVIFYPLLILMFILSTPSFSSEEIISLKISDLEKWIRIYSPEMKISGNEKKIGEISGYIDSGLEFTNPDISFKNESLKSGSLSEKEQEIEISKSFDLIKLQYGSQKISLLDFQLCCAQQAFQCITNLRLEKFDCLLSRPHIILS